jgi:hypothetical protein
MGFSGIKTYICHKDKVILNQSPENYLNENFHNGDSIFAL